MIEDLKVLANERDVPYQSLLKVFLAERLESETPARIGEDSGFGVTGGGYLCGHPIKRTQCLFRSSTFSSASHIGGRPFSLAYAARVSPMRFRNDS